MQDATKFGADCMQTRLANSRAPGVSEDCLTLNVWAVLSSLLAGGGNDASLWEVDDAVKRLLFASDQIGLVAGASGELGKLAKRQSAAGREPFQHAVRAALSRWRPGEPSV